LVFFVSFVFFVVRWGLAASHRAAV